MTRGQFAEQMRIIFEGGTAYDTFDSILGSIPVEKRGVVPAGAERSAWQVLDHIRIAVEDILEFTNNFEGGYRERDWPAEYWPVQPEPPASNSWDDCVAAIRLANAALVAEAGKEGRDLVAPFPWSAEHTLLREVLLAADHQSHHLGQLTIISRLLEN